MGRFSEPYGQLLGRLDEVRILLKAAKAIERKDSLRRSGEINALCRAGIVLLTSHLEGYIKDIGEHALYQIYIKKVDRVKFEDRFFYHISRSKIQSLQDARDPFKIVQAIKNLFDEEKKYWQASGPFPAEIPTEIFNDGFSTPNFDKINMYLKRFGYESFHSEFKRSLKEKAIIIETAINDLVQVRNDIAHGNIHALRTPEDLRSMIDSTQIFCRTADDIFCRWFRQKYCSLRN